MNVDSLRTLIKKLSHIRRIQHLFARHIAVERSCRNICVTEQMLNGSHSNAERIFLRCEFASTAATARLEASSEIDDFKA